MNSYVRLVVIGDMARESCVLKMSAEKMSNFYNKRIMFCKTIENILVSFQSVEIDSSQVKWLRDMNASELKRLLFKKENMRKISLNNKRKRKKQKRNAQKKELPVEIQEQEQQIKTILRRKMGDERC